MAGEPKPAARRGAAKKGSKEYVRDDRDEMIDRAVASRRLLAPEQVAALSPAQQERYVAEHPGGGQKEVKVKVPAIGRIVHWYDDALVPAPGIIVRGSSQPRDTVRVLAFTAERGLTLTDAKYSEAPTANCWTWPPFVADVSEFIDLTEEEAAAQASAAATFDALRAGVGA
jgi:hypothetical protein